MNINQIKQVLTIAEEKNFTNAAKKLFISQPSLSKSIKLLEEELGVELFERNPIKLTHAGVGKFYRVPFKEFNAEFFFKKLNAFA